MALRRLKNWQTRWRHCKQTSTWYCDQKKPYFGTVMVGFVDVWKGPRGGLKCSGRVISHRGGKDLGTVNRLATAKRRLERAVKPRA